MRILRNRVKFKQSPFLPLITFCLFMSLWLEPVIERQIFSLVFFLGFTIGALALSWYLPFNGYLLIDDKGLTAGYLFFKKFIKWSDIGFIKINSTLNNTNPFSQVLYVYHKRRGRVRINRVSGLTVYELYSLLIKLDEKARTYSKGISSNDIKSIIDGIKNEEHEKYKMLAEYNFSYVKLQFSFLWLRYLGICGILGTVLIAFYYISLKPVPAGGTILSGAILCMILMIISMILFLSYRVVFFDPAVKSVFTACKICGKPFHFRKASDKVHSIYINDSGDANIPYYQISLWGDSNTVCCKNFLRLCDAKRSAKILSEKINLPVEDSLFCQDGKISKFLRMIFDNIIALIVLIPIGLLIFGIIWMGLKIIRFY